MIVTRRIKLLVTISHDRLCISNRISVKEKNVVTRILDEHKCICCGDSMCLLSIVIDVAEIMVARSRN